MNTLNTITIALLTVCILLAVGLLGLKAITP